MSFRVHFTTKDYFRPPQKEEAGLDGKKKEKRAGWSWRAFGAKGKRKQGPLTKLGAEHIRVSSTAGRGR